MRLPQTPPDWTRLLNERGENVILQTLNKAHDPAYQVFLREVNDKYLHWDKLRFHPLPEGIDALEAWGMIKFSRSGRQELPLTFSENRNLTYGLHSRHAEWLHQIDREAGSGRSIMPRSLPDDSDRYVTNSLMEEAIASSQLEGASTTRKVAKEMLRSGRMPRDKAEQMIINNYNAILEIRELKKNKFTPEVLCHLQNVLTAGTLADPSASGRFRTAAEHVTVVDATTGEDIYVPPGADAVAGRIQELCDFANIKSTPFVHPVIKAVALHFAIGFVHPFVDGNGRTARAAFYWHMLKEGYSSFEYLPISRVLINGPMKYARAFLYTETDEGDLTYFIHYHLRAIIKAISNLHAYLAAQIALLKEANDLLDDMELNYRQLELIRHALKHPDDVYTAATHAGKYRVTFPTARSDLLGLERAGLLTQFKKGRAGYFRPASNVLSRLQAAQQAKEKLR